MKPAVALMIILYSVLSGCDSASPPVDFASRASNPLLLNAVSDLSVRQTWNRTESDERSYTHVSMQAALLSANEAGQDLNFSVMDFQQSLADPSVDTGYHNAAVVGGAGEGNAPLLSFRVRWDPVTGERIVVDSMALHSAHAVLPVSDVRRGEAAGDLLRWVTELALPKLPAGKLKAGDSWTDTITAMYPLPMQVVQTYRVDSVHKGRTVCSVEGQISPSPVNRLFGGSGIASGLTGTRRGQFVLNRRMHAIEELQLTQELDGSYLLMGQPVSIRMLHQTRLTAVAP